MTGTLHERIEDYLNGHLSDKETRQFENDLLKKEVPPGLAERIEASLDLKTSISTGKAKPKRPSSFGQIVNGFKWGLRGPGYALAGISSSPITLKNILSGMDTVGYSLGPLNEPVRDRINAIRLPEKPLWKIALSKLW